MNQLSPILKTLKLQLVECGKIKIGGKGQERTGKNGSYNLPVKYDGFVITKLDKDGVNFTTDFEAMQKLGGWDEKNKQIVPLKKIPVTFTDDDLTRFFQTSMACYQGKTCICRGDGERAINANGEVVSCPCEKSQKKQNGAHECKPNGRLSCQITKVTPIGKVHTFRTTGYNTIQSLFSGLYSIYSETGGRFRGLQLWLTYDKKTIVDQFGKTQLIPVIGIEYNGTRTQMREAIEKNASAEAGFLKNMKKLEGYGIGLSDEPLLGIEDLPEFYPNNEIENQEKKELPQKKEIIDEQTGEIIEESSEPTREELIETLYSWGWSEEQLKGKRLNTLVAMVDACEKPQKIENNEQDEYNEEEEKYISDQAIEDDVEDDVDSESIEDFSDL